ncbi:MAG TPA: hypothetical protein VGB55_01350 [Tepidisphaeraceae bacterium]|jgi:hypothetical protein
MTFARPICVLALLACLTAPAVAAPDPIEPFLDDQTVLVARVDLRQIDLPKAVAWGADALKRVNAPADLTEKFVRDTSVPALVGQAVAQQLVAAGTNEVAVVVRIDPDSRQPQFFGLVATPTKPGSLNTIAAGVGLTATPANGVTVLTRAQDKDVLTALRDVDKAPRPRLLEPLAAAGAAVIVSAEAGSQVRDLIDQALRDAGAPDEPRLGVLLDGMSPLTLSLSAKQVPALVIKAKGQTPEAAAALKQLIDQQEDGPAPASTIVMLRDTLKPALAGDTLSALLDPPSVDRLLRKMLPAFLAAEKTAR